MNILFLTSKNNTIGYGHYVRTKVLYDYVKKQGHETELIVRDFTPKDTKYDRIVVDVPDFGFLMWLRGITNVPIMDLNATNEHPFATWCIVQGGSSTWSPYAGHDFVLLRPEVFTCTWQPSDITITYGDVPTNVSQKLHNVKVLDRREQPVLEWLQTISHIKEAHVAFGMIAWELFVMDVPFTSYPTTFLNTAFWREFQKAREQALKPTPETPETLLQLLCQ